MIARVLATALAIAGLIAVSWFITSAGERERGSTGIEYAKVANSNFVKYIETGDSKWLKRSRGLVERGANRHPYSPEIAFVAGLIAQEDHDSERAELLWHYAYNHASTEQHFRELAAENYYGIRAARGAP